MHAQVVAGDTVAFCRRRWGPNFWRHYSFVLSVTRGGLAMKSRATRGRRATELGCVLFHTVEIRIHHGVHGRKYLTPRRQVQSTTDNGRRSKPSCFCEGDKFLPRRQVVCCPAISSTRLAVWSTTQARTDSASIGRICVGRSLTPAAAGLVRHHACLNHQSIVVADRRRNLVPHTLTEEIASTPTEEVWPRTPVSAIDPAPFLPDSGRM
jgi:hypothetical protein